MDDTFSGDITFSISPKLPPELLESAWGRDDHNWGEPQSNSLTSIETLKTDEPTSENNSTNNNALHLKINEPVSDTLIADSDASRVENAKEEDIVNSPLSPVEFDLSSNPWATGNTTVISPPDTPHKKPTGKKLETKDEVVGEGERESTRSLSVSNAMIDIDDSDITIKNQHFLHPPAKTSSTNGSAFPSPPMHESSSSYLEDLSIEGGFTDDGNSRRMSFSGHPHHFQQIQRVYDPEKEALVSHVMDLQEAMRELIIKIETTKVENMDLEDQNVILIEYINNMMMYNKNKSLSREKG